MYCVQCGVELQKGVSKCPLCGLRVYHPDLLTETPEARPYPPFDDSAAHVRRGGLLLILSFLFALPVIVCLMVDLKLSGGVTWSGYVTAGVLAAILLMPSPMNVFLPSASGESQRSVMRRHAASASVSRSSSAIICSNASSE